MSDHDDDPKTGVALSDGPARVLQMVDQTGREGFGHCSKTEACQVECPQQISVLHIARMNWEYNRALLSPG
jgi:hypothetical protein